MLTLLSLILACSDPEERALEDNLLEEIRAFDLDNQGNASDIRVRFQVKNNLNVIEYRVMAVPSQLKGSFDEAVAETVPVTSYVGLPAQSLDLEYSISRLPATLTDINGSTVQEGEGYVLVVYIIGEGDRQLSKFSRVLTLADVDPVIGSYEVVESNALHVDSLILATIDPGGLGLFDATIFNYYNEAVYPQSQCPDRFIVDNVRVYAFDGSIFSDVQWIIAFCGDPTAVCAGRYVGSGVVVDEITIEWTFEKDVACLPSQEVFITVTRK